MSKTSPERHDQKTPDTDLDALYKVFKVAEPDSSTLAQIDREISKDLAEFLNTRIVATHVDIETIEQSFLRHKVPAQPYFVGEYTHFMMDNLVAQSVHTAAPGFVGHMTSALPNFMLPFSRIMTALNQNLVKIETSKAFTPMERQVLGMLHELIYQQSDSFYQEWMHSSNAALGAHCSGGTLANLTALWAARNRIFTPEGSFTGISRQGINRALRHYGFDDAVILVSQRAHYSLAKSADVLGIGRDNIIAIETDDQQQIDLNKLKQTCLELSQNNIRIIAIVGVAGTTETGAIDPLPELANLATHYNCHFHVDAAWGGPTLFSHKHRHLLDGIELADSVTIDAHKQLYVPMGSGMVLFRNPEHLNHIEHHAQYILRQGSKDIGSHTIEGSRSGSALLLHAAFHILGRQGYELLIDQGIEKTRQFAEHIKQLPDFELCNEPKLNIMTYRFVPSQIQVMLQSASPETRVEINEVIDKVTAQIQKVQRERGKSFVSRTRLAFPSKNSQPLTVFRVVIANPLTQTSDLLALLEEQIHISQNDKLVKTALSELGYSPE